MHKNYMQNLWSWLYYRWGKGQSGVPGQKFILEKFEKFSYPPPAMNDFVIPPLNSKKFQGFYRRLHIMHLNQVYHV